MLLLVGSGFGGGGCDIHGVVPLSALLGSA